MSETEFKLKEENKFIKELFNSNGDETQFKHIKEMIQHSIISSTFVIKLLDIFSKYRPHHHNISKQLIECVYSRFPGQIDEIQEYIKRTYNVILKYIKFPEEFPIEGSKEQQEMFLLLQQDDIDGFILFLSNHPTIDITKQQKLAKFGYYFYLFGCNWNCDSISLIDFCCLFGSLKCFKYLLLNKCKITTKGFHNTLKYSIAGGNQEIINILKENGHSFEEYLETSVYYHRYELTHWLNENYKCEPVSLPTCIEYFNIDAFLYFLEHGHSLEETDCIERTCLHHASFIGSLPIVQFLVEKGANIEAKDNGKRTPLHIACEEGHLPIVQYLIEKGANIEAKSWAQETPLHITSYHGKTDVVKYLLSKGANKNVKNKWNQTPYDVACDLIDDKSQREIIREEIQNFIE